MKKYIDDLSQHEQILKRPDTYIGSVVNLETKNPVWINSQNNFIQKKINYPDGLIRIWIEPSSNAIDNIWRSRDENVKMTSIKYTINDNKFSVWNDGKALPIRKQIYSQDNTEMWIPEIAFGKLSTSTNYNDNEERKTSGRNGFGVKLTNIFSTHFEIECFDSESNQLYTQKWENNMKKRKDPVIKNKKSKNYTLVSWTPDYKRFNITELSSDIIFYIERLIYFSACYASEYNIKVYYNDNVVNIKSLYNYALKFFEQRDEEDQSENLKIETNDCKVVLLPSENNKYNLQSSVNGIETVNGGTHVEPWEEILFRPIVNYINENNKNAQKINIDTVKNKLCLFISATLDKPQFSSQNKTELIFPTVNSVIISYP